MESVTAAISSDSVELSALIDWVINKLKTAPLHYVNTNAVVDILFVGSFPYEVSKKHKISILSISCLGLGMFLYCTIICNFGSRRSSRGPLIFYLILQSIVIQRYLACFSGNCSDNQKERKRIQIVWWCQIQYLV